MQSHTSVERSASVQARQLLPLLGVEFGYHIYILEALRHRTTSPLYRSASAAVAALETILTQFVPTTQEGFYALKFRAAANSLSRAIVRGKRELWKEEDAAETQLKQELKNFAINDFKGGLMKAGWQMLMLGGFVVFAVKAIISLPSVEADVSSEHQWFASIATALGVGLLFPMIRSFLIHRTQSKLYQVYRDATQKARATYKESIGREYRFAIASLEEAWEELTGEKLPHSQVRIIDTLGDALTGKVDANLMLDETLPPELLDAEDEREAVAQS